MRLGLLALVHRREVPALTDRTVPVSLVLRGAVTGRPLSRAGVEAFAPNAVVASVVTRAVVAATAKRAAVATTPKSASVSSYSTSGTVTWLTSS